MAVLFKSLADYRPAFVTDDLIAGLTLAAIAIPEQMATARLGNFEPQFGFYAFLAGAVAFLVFGGSRYLSAGADSTITPIFAGGLALLAGGAPGHMGALAAGLALWIGLWLTIGGLFKMGFIADLLSVPVTTGFLAGVSLHILVSQLPAAMGIEGPPGTMLEKLAGLVTQLPHSNPYTWLIGLGVLAIVIVSERISARIPGALIGLVLATLITFYGHLQGKGVSVLGAFSGHLPSVGLPMLSFKDYLALVPMSLIIALVVMVQSAATTRSFPSQANEPPDVDQDFIGVGVGNLLAALFGTFAINASPPRTAIVSETGGHSQLAGLFAAALVLLVLLYGGALLAFIPHAALAGILIFVALRIFRLPVMARLLMQTKPEFLLMAATFLAIILLPIERGVAVGIILSLLNGLWSVSRARALEFFPIPGTTIWWPPQPQMPAVSVPGILVIGFQAPLSFLNAYGFRRDVLAALAHRGEGVHLLVLEASSILEIDYTAAQILQDVVRQCRARGTNFAIARLESLRAQAALQRFGIDSLIDKDHIFQSVAEAIANKK